jgi:outer membrane biosynthesis protein TonB
MLPSRYRGRYSIIILLSLLVHFTVIVALFWVSDKQDEQTKTEKTVTVTLKQKEDPKKEEPKKEEPKKEEAKEEETFNKNKKQKDVQQAKPKPKPKPKPQPKPKPKPQPKPKPKPKPQPKPKPKPQPKKDLVEKLQGGFKGYNDSQNFYGPDETTSSKIEEKIPEPVFFKQIGSMEILDDIKMKAQVIHTEKQNLLFQRREEEAKRFRRKKMTEAEIQKEQDEYVAAANQIFSNYLAPKRQLQDLGKKYYGEIRFLIDDTGMIREISYRKNSGSEALDQAFLESLKKTVRLELPEDPIVKFYFILKPKILFYDERDFAE